MQLQRLRATVCRVPADGRRLRRPGDRDGDFTIPRRVGKDEFAVHHRRVKFEVEETFRGQQRTSVEVTTGQGGGDCGFDFRTGEHYLVYANHLPQTGQLYTGICSRTRPLSEAEADLDFLRKRGDPGRGAGLEGSILEIGRDPKTNATPTRGPMKGVRVVVEGSGRKLETTTDAQGWFQFWGLPAGEYAVRPVLPRNFVPEERKVRITPSSCGWVNMLATPYLFPSRNSFARCRRPETIDVAQAAC